jgi:hypothetical protein
MARAARSLPVLYSGPLRAYHAAGGPPSLADVVATDCGSRIVRDTWVIVSGAAASPERAAETLFLERRGHVLLYNATSRATVGEPSLAQPSAALNEPASSNGPTTASAFGRASTAAATSRTSSWVTASIAARISSTGSSRG